MTERSGPGPAAPAGGAALRPGKPLARPPDRRQQRRWVPLAAGWLALLIGLADVILGTEGGALYQHVKHPLLRFAAIAPGTLAGLTRVAEVLLGLALLMLSHGLRRRKRRAWEMAILALATSVVVHLLHQRYGAIIAPVALLVALLCYRREFYASGDPRTRWRALWALGGLAIADVAIGLGYLSVAQGLSARYSTAQQLQSVIYQLLGFHGPIYFTTETRQDVFNVLTGGLSLFTLIVVGYLFLRPAEPAGRPSAKDAARIRALL